jgi:hypothetical protein
MGVSRVQDTQKALINPSVFCPLNVAVAPSALVLHNWQMQQQKQLQRERHHSAGHAGKPTSKKKTASCPCLLQPKHSAPRFTSIV